MATTPEQDCERRRLMYVDQAAGEIAEWLLARGHTSIPRKIYRALEVLSEECVRVGALREAKSALDAMPITELLEPPEPEPPPAAPTAPPPPGWPDEPTPVRHVDFSSAETSPGWPSSQHPSRAPTRPVSSPELAGGPGKTLRSMPPPPPRKR